MTSCAFNSVGSGSLPSSSIFPSCRKGKLNNARSSPSLLSSSLRLVQASPWTTATISSSRRRIHLKPLHAQLSTIEQMTENLDAEKRSSSCLQVYHDFEFEVRDYELDQYGVVNNAVYSQYMEHGYAKMFDKIGVDLRNFVSAGHFLATYEKSLKFVAPLMRKDRFVVKVKIEKISSTRLFFECTILKLPNKEVVLEGRSTIVWLDNNYRPTRIPAEVRTKLQ